MQELRSALAEDARFSAAILFGSVVRGSLREDSDIDVAVLLRDQSARVSLEQDIVDVLGTLGLAARRDVHLVDLELAGPPLCRTIVAQGSIVFDRSDGALHALYVRSLLQYLDDAYLRQVVDRGKCCAWSELVVDADILRSKTERILHHCDRLAVRSDVDTDRLIADEDLRNTVMKVVRHDLDDLRQFASALRG